MSTESNTPKRSRTEKRPRSTNAIHVSLSPRRFSDTEQLKRASRDNLNSNMSKDTAPQMSEALICAICLHLMDEQFKVLNCGHSFCLKCLERCVASKPRRHRGVIACPKCKQLTELPQGVAGLKTNYDLKAIRDVLVETGNGEVPSGKPAAVKYRNNTIGNAQMNLNATTEQYQQYLKENKDLVRSIKDSAKTVEYDINEHFKAIVTILEENKRRLLQDVEDIRNTRIGQVEEDKAKAEKTMKVFKECKERLKKVEKMKPSEEEYEAHINSVCTETDAMISNRPPEISPNLAWMEYIPETAAGSIQCGRLKTDRTVDIQLEHEFGRGWVFKLGKARGIAVTQKGLLAIAESTANRVSVWENVKGEYQRKFCLKTPWHTHALQKPTDVAVTAGEKFVVVDGANTLKVFSATGEYDENEWVKGEGTTCITSDPRLNCGSRILMDSRRDIARYETSGLILPPIVAGTTSHAIATNGKKVAISNLKEVKIFDVESGEKLLSFDARIRGLCFDGETDSILATTCDRQIAQYCAETGQMLGIVSTECLNDPWGLVIIPGRRLAVADDQSVKVYCIKDHL